MYGHIEPQCWRWPQLHAIQFHIFIKWIGLWRLEKLHDSFRAPYELVVEEKLWSKLSNPRVFLFITSSKMED